MSKDHRTRNDLRIICDVQCKKVRIKKVEERKSKVEELKTVIHTKPQKYLESECYRAYQRWRETETLIGAGTERFVNSGGPSHTPGGPQFFAAGAKMRSQYTPPVTNCQYTYIS
jgi:hypothetical protein